MKWNTEKRFNPTDNLVKGLKIMYKYILCLVFLVSCVACSDNEMLVKKQEPTVQLQQHPDTEKTAQKQTPKAMEPSEEDKAKYKAAAMAIMGKLQNNTKTIQQLLNLWGKFYGAGLTDAELKNLEEAANTDVQASQKALTEFTLEVGPLIEKALHNYMDELKSVTKECAKCNPKK